MCEGLVITILVIVTMLLTAVQGYFWYYDPELGQCSVRQQVLEGGLTSVWSIWSWVTEMLIFAAVPFSILGLNFCVIIEVGRIARRHRETIRGLLLNQVSYRSDRPPAR